jgi:Subtilisin inhibitor-like
MAVFLAAIAAATSLHITVWPHGMHGPKRSWTLSCAPAGGTLPRPATACRRLAKVAHPFRPVPKNAACTAIYGGPQVALVTGRLRGGRVHASFSRRNGCEVDRWNRVRFLFPVVTGAP